MTTCKKTDWPKVRLGSLAEFRNGVNFSKQNFGTGIRVIGVSDFQDNVRASYDGLDEINPEGVVRKEHLLKNGDILFVRSNGNRELIGRNMYVENVPGSVTHSAFSIRLRFTSERCYPRFYAYLFRSQFIRQALSLYGGGTNISNLNQDILGRLEVPVPMLSEQERVAAILASYDDLIENNTQRIRILEHMAQMLYREWFVNLRFPGHEKVKRVESEMGPIPENWIPTTIGNLCEDVRRSVNPADIPTETPYIGLEHMPRKSIALSEWGEAGQVQSTKLRFRRGEILFGKIRPYFHKVGVAPVDGVCSSDAIVIVPKAAELFAVVLMCVSSEDFVLQATQTSQGTKMPRANWDVLRRYPVALPDTPLLERFNATVTPMVELIINLVFRNRCLQASRDLLLPKLVSGELCVPELAAEGVTA